MKRTAIGLLVAALALVAQKADDAERMLKAAQNIELVDGNLQAAIAQYKKLAEGGNRAVAAKALLRMAECYQKMGDAESKKIYERVVREYGDQKEAVALAETKLGRGGEKPLVIRELWSGGDVDLNGSPSPDGRYITYANWKNKGNLAIRDLKTGESRDLTHETDGSFAEDGVFTPDGRHIFYLWYSEPKAEYELRTMAADGTGVKLTSNAEFAPAADSRDGKLLAGVV